MIKEWVLCDFKVIVYLIKFRYNIKMFNFFLFYLNKSNRLESGFRDVINNVEGNYFDY